MSKLSELEDRVAALEAAVLRMKPVRGGSMTVEERKAIRVQTAAAARAAKQVGKGKGSLKTAAMRKKLKQQAGE